MSGRAPRGASIALALSASGAFWMGWFNALWPAGPIPTFCAALSLAAVLLLLFPARLPRLPGVHSLSGGLLTAYPLVLFLLLLITTDDAAMLTADVRLWPLALMTACALAAGRLLQPPPVQSAVLAAILLLTLTLMIAGLYGATGLIERWVLRSPFHIAIFTTATTVLCALLPTFSHARAPSAAIQEARFVQELTQLLPLLGFAGTIWGISLALTSLPQVLAAEGGADPAALNTLLGALATAFETTLLGIAGTALITLLSAFLPE